MTLTRRLTGQLALLLACLLLTAGAAILCVRGLRQDFSLALGHYERLRQLYLVGFHLQSARTAMSLDFPDIPQARLDVLRAKQLFQQTAVDDEANHRAADALNAAANAMAAGRPSVKVLDQPLALMNVIADGLRTEIAAAQHTADQRQRNTLVALLIIVASATVISIWISRRQLRTVLRPLAAMSSAVKRVAEGHFDTPLTMPAADREFATLAEDFNTMARELSAGREALEARVEAATRAMVQSERLAGVGLLAAGVAHEINNPLSIITGRIELLLTKPTEPAMASALSIVLDEAFRCKQIIERLLMLSRGPAGRRSRVELGRIAQELVAAVETLPAAKGRRLETAIHAAFVHADDGEMRQVLLNLLLNAVQFTAEGYVIRVDVRSDAGSAVVTIADDGQGIEPAAMARLFEPFYSTRVGQSRGTGLGLAISRAIVESHGGRIEAFSDGPGQGSRFVVTLPLDQGDVE